MTITSRPRSPWPGSTYQARHRWQLDDVGNLDVAAERLRAIASELDAAAAAGWALLEPLRGGHVHAARPSRRQRARDGVPDDRPVPGGPPPGGDTAPGRPPTARPWRVRLVNEPPCGGDAVLDLRACPGTAVVAGRGGKIAQVCGPAVPPSILARLMEQLGPQDLESSAWGLAPGRFTPAGDLVADGSALRVHAVVGGALVQTVEAYAFPHAADRAVGLREAAASYRELAGVLRLCAAAGGRLDNADDGMLHVVYSR